MATSNVTMIDRATLRLLQEQMAAALRSLGDQYGIDIKVGRGTYSNGPTGSVKLEIAVRPTTGASAATAGSGFAARGKADFVRYARLFGVTPEDYEAQVTVNGTPYILTGIKPNRPKYPFEARHARTGTGYKLSQAQVLSGLQRTRGDGTATSGTPSFDALTASL